MKPLCLCLLFFCPLLVCSQAAINNLAHPPSYQTGTWGTLGKVEKFGDPDYAPTSRGSVGQAGTQDMILLPGWGLDASVFSAFIKRHEKDYRIWAVTFPGFGGTPAPPMPAQSEVYRDLNWTKGILKGLNDLIDREKIKSPIVVSLFSYSNLIALRMALDYPEKIGKVIIISGIGKFMGNYPSYEPRSLDARCNFIEKYLAPQWFKTVSVDTWNKGNFVPGTFSKDSIAAARHWNMMSAVPIPVMVRYLCEFYCTDLSLEYSKLTVPTLIVIPAFTPAFLAKPEHSYIAPFFHSSWIGALPGSAQIQMTTISDAHAFIMDDQPDKLNKVINEFITGKFQPYPPVR